jgi:hypothetical protein
MMTRQPVDSAEPEYEFSAGQNGLFSQLATSMKFSGIAMIAVSTLLWLIGARAAWAEVVTAAGRGLQAPARSLRFLFVVPAGVLFFVPALAVGAKGIHLYKAADHFKLIAQTTGSDMKNLTIAVKELTGVYATQRWIWLVCGILILAALLTTASS